MDRRLAVLSACTGDWVIELDADERVTPELAAEIPVAIGGAESGFFMMPFDNYISDRLVRHGWGRVVERLRGGAALLARRKGVARLPTHPPAGSPVRTKVQARRADRPLGRPRHR